MKLKRQGRLLRWAYWRTFDPIPTHISLCRLFWRLVSQTLRALFLVAIILGFFYAVGFLGVAFVRVFGRHPLPISFGLAGLAVLSLSIWALYRVDVSHSLPVEYLK